MVAARNILIILALAAIVEFAPGGGDTAALINAILFTLLNVVFVYFGVRFYRERPPYRSNRPRSSLRWRGRGGG